MGNGPLPDLGLRCRRKLWVLLYFIGIDEASGRLLRDVRGD
jgi:hypothetical protein